MISERDLAASCRERAKKMRDWADIEPDKKVALTFRKTAAAYDELGACLADLAAKHENRRRA